MRHSSSELTPTDFLAIRPRDPRATESDLGETIRGDELPFTSEVRESLAAFGLRLVPASGPIGRNYESGRLPDSVSEALPVFVSANNRVTLAAPRITALFPDVIPEAKAAAQMDGLASHFEPGVESRAYTVAVPAGANTLAFAEHVRSVLSKDHREVRVFPEYLFRVRGHCTGQPVTVGPGESVYEKQWHLRNPDPSRLGIDLHAEGAWEYTRGSGQTVAVIDLGFDYDHPNLKAAIRADSGHFPSSDAYNPTSQTTNKPVHGTMIAGAVGARPARPVEIYGIAPECSLLLLSIDEWSSGAILANAFSYACRWGTPWTFPRTFPRSFPWFTPRADVIVCSADPEPADEGGKTMLLEALGKLGSARRGKGIPAFTSTDNTARPIPGGGPGDDPEMLLANHDNVIAVGRTAQDDTRAPCAYGEKLAFLAPGVDIFTTKPYDSTATEGFYIKKGGSSLSAALAAGVAALVLDVNPNLSSTEVEEILVAACDRTIEMPADEPRTEKHGHGRLNAMKAVLYATYGVA